MQITLKVRIIFVIQFNLLNIINKKNKILK